MSRPAQFNAIVAGLELRGLDLLDIGCGSGEFAPALIRDHGAGRVAGVDERRELIDRALARAAESGLEARLSFRLLEGGGLPFAALSFDAILVRDRPIGAGEAAVSLAEMRRVLRPGGIVAGFGCRGTTDPSSIVSQLEQAGFADVEVRGQDPAGHSVVRAYARMY
ncbi:MAG: class I SAM-dependent methyltransferase [Alphaproteobacteria bacterium]|nr:class I SAM-dependent methyltransferase [Alphaproteobacteria bacterium]